MRRPRLIAYLADKGTARSAMVLVAALTALLPACTRSEETTPALGPDCRLWVETARRAQRCDPALAFLATTVTNEPDEGRCQVAARSLLNPSAPRSSKIESIHRANRTPRFGALTPTERAELEALEFPATIDLVPDFRGEPGLTPTRAWVGEREATSTDDGRLRASVPAGAHALRIKHGADERGYCVRLQQCTRLSVVLHGASPARHPAVRAGPCSAGSDADAASVPPGATEAASAQLASPAAASSAGL